MRVRIRRLLALLDLIHTLENSDSIVHLRKRLKKILKQLGPLRDIQVELATVRKLKPTGEIRAFGKFLARKEKAEIGRVVRKLHHAKKAKLRLRKSYGSEVEGAVLSEVRNLILKRYRRFAATRKAFDPASGSSLHAMRIAFKKYRYALESAWEVFQWDPGNRAEKMHAYQKLMGNLRDCQLLEANLRRWLKRRSPATGIALRTILDRLARQQRRWMSSLLNVGTDHSIPQF